MRQGATRPTKRQISACWKISSWQWVSRESEAARARARADYHLWPERIRRQKEPNFSRFQRPNPFMALHACRIGRFAFPMTGEHRASKFCLSFAFLGLNSFHVANDNL